MGLTPVTLVEPADYDFNQEGRKRFHCDFPKEYYGSPWYAEEIKLYLESIGFIDRSHEGDSYEYAVGTMGDRFPDGIVSPHDFIIRRTEDWGFETEGIGEREAVEMALYFSDAQRNDPKRTAQGQLFLKVFDIIPLENCFRSDWD
jgi:hypothetical protein